MAKEKKEKVIVRKCHHCGKPIAEGKDFCLYCGHSYTTEDPFAAEKKAKRNRILKKLGVFLGVCAAVGAIVWLTVFLVLKEINKSDFLRIVEFITEEGEFVEGVVPPEDESSAEDTEDESEGLEDSEEESSEEESSEEESTDESASEGDETEGDEESSEEKKPERLVCDITQYDRYVYTVKSTTKLVCLAGEEHRFFILYTDEVEGFVTDITLELDENTKDEYLWRLISTYTDTSISNTDYSFVREYHGTFDPHDFTSLYGDVNVAETETETEEETEGEGDETATEGDETSTETETETETETSTETETETETDGDETEGEGDETATEGEEETTEPMLPPEQSIENAALKMVSLQVRDILTDLIQCLEDNRVGVDIANLGLTKYKAYLESLDPLKNGSNKLF